MVQATVIVSTYNDPQALDLIFRALQRQTIRPTDVVVADDGSGTDTSDLVSYWKNRLGVPLGHVWQEDKGYRKGKIGDRAVEAADGDYLVFLDGDSIPHSKWLADHLYAAKSGRVVCGRRVRLGPKISRRVRNSELGVKQLEVLAGPLLFSGLRGDSKRYTLGMRWPSFLSRLRYPGEKRLMGVNFSLHRADFEEAKGFGHWDRRREDIEVEIRLLKTGMRRFPLMHRGVVYHLYHPEAQEDDQLDQEMHLRYEQALSYRDQL